MSAKLYLMCGLAFAGKSTLARGIAERTGAAVVSLDEINRARGFDGGVGIGDEEWACTYGEALREVERALSRGRSVVVDDTSCFRFLRDGYRELAERHEVPAVVVYVDVPLATALARLRANERHRGRAPVEEAVLVDLARKIEPPEPDEPTLVCPPDADPVSWLEENVPRE